MCQIYHKTLRSFCVVIDQNNRINLIKNEGDYSRFAVQKRQIHSTLDGNLENMFLIKFQKNRNFIRFC